MVSSTLKLGISILNGGNADVQQVTEGTWEGEPKKVRGSCVTPSSSSSPTSSAENVGLSEGQERSWLLPEYPGADADMQVGSSEYLLVKLFGVAVPPPLVPLPVPVLLLVPGAETHSDQLNDKEFIIRIHMQQ